MPTKAKAAHAATDPDKADEQPVTRKQSALDLRIAGAYFLGGQWRAADGTPLNDVESQAAHRARDREEAEAKRLAILGR